MVAMIIDPEEFLNLLFKHVLHVEPFLQIRLVYVCTLPCGYWVIHKYLHNQLHSIIKISTKNLKKLQQYV